MASKEGPEIQRKRENDSSDRETKKSKGGKRRRKGKRKGGEQARAKPGYVHVVRENPNYEEYYKKQGIVPEGEWDSFMAILKEDLPATFRITGSKCSAALLSKVFEEKYFKELQDIEVEGERIPSPKVIPWYPHRLAWHIPLSRRFIRKSPLMGKFHKFLVSETEQGVINRQEAVSMIPPLFLDVKPHHKVLDMCAAPGSKTAQIIEALHSEDTPTNPCPSGVVVANDADNKRCYMLVHQAKRLSSPCVMVTNHDASVLPDMFYTKEDGSRVKLMYDRILCDVPCSGDGTLRKNLTIWRTWTPSQAIGLHKTQIRILLRGLEVLATGGRLVYSTCSLNPIENEAVISTALQACKGSVELVDVSTCLTELKRAPGVKTWKVMLKDGQWLQSAEDLTSLPQNVQRILPKTLFPPTEEETADLHLERCVRVLPHWQDTGGFFVAVLHKSKELPWKEKQKERPQDTKVETDESQSEQTVTDTKEQPSSLKGKNKSPLDTLGRQGYTKRRNLGYKEDPFVFMQEEDEVLKMIKSSYGFSDDFPNQQLLTRTLTGKKRNVYFVSNLIHSLTVQNEKAVKIINIGTKSFARCTCRKASCDFRLAQESIHHILPYIHKLVVKATRSDLVTLLKVGNPLFSSLSNEAAQSYKRLSVGPCVTVYNSSLEDSQNFEITALSTWRASQSARLFVTERERIHYLSILGEDIPDHLCLTTQNVYAGKTSLDEGGAPEDEPQEEMDPSLEGVEEKNDLDINELESTNEEESMDADINNS